jgi:hypothetical protein
MLRTQIKRRGQTFLQQIHLTQPRRLPGRLGQSSEETAIEAFFSPPTKAATTTEPSGSLMRPKPRPRWITKTTPREDHHHSHHNHHANPLISSQLEPRSNIPLSVDSSFEPHLCDDNFHSTTSTASPQTTSHDSIRRQRHDKMDYAALNSQLTLLDGSNFMY